jgi:hypothetical protein
MGIEEIRQNRPADLPVRNVYFISMLRSKSDQPKEEKNV